MTLVLRITTVVLVLTFILFAFLGVNDYVPRQYMAIPFGLASMSFALEVLVSRRDLIGRVKDRAGSPRWKLGLFLFWVVGSVTAVMGVYPSLTLLPNIAKNIVVLCTVVTVVSVVMAILRVKTLTDNTENPIDTIKEAETYIAYGRRAQAITILEDALSRFPNQRDIVRKLLELKNEN